MHWVTILVLIMVVVCFVSVFKPARDFVADWYDKFSAWHLSMLVEAKEKNLGIRENKKKLFSNMKEVLDKTGNGFVLEIGCGSGANVSFYPPGTKLITCDLNDHFKPYLLKNLEEKSQDVSLAKYLIGNAENMQTLLDDNSCSCVVSSLLLCCVDQEKVLREVMRVLKPGGRFYFIEHLIEQPGTWTRIIQILMTPIWSRLRFNCHLDRNTDITLKNFGFDNFHGDVWYRPIPKRYFFVKRTFIGYGDKHS